MKAHRTLHHGFTLTELLVVIAIIVLLIVLALPAFSTMIMSQESAAAEQRLSSAMSAARDAAIRSGAGQDTAAVFYYEPGGKMTIVTCQRVGTLNDTSSNPPVLREVFVPLDTVEPIDLPRYWMVRAYAPASAVGVADWYDIGSGAVRYPANQPAWVFPETGFYDCTAVDAGQDRQTFMVRFEGGTGVQMSGLPDPVLVLSPRPSETNRPTGTAQEWRRPDRANDLRRWTVRTLTDRRNLTDQERVAMIGNISSDMVLARGSTMLALYDERKMAAALGVRPDPVSGSLYFVDPTAIDQGRQAVRPEFVPGPRVRSAAMNRWIEGYANPTQNDNVRAETPDARVFTVDRYVGAIRPVQVQLQPVGVTGGGT